MDRLQVMRSLDKLDRIGRDGVKMLLTDGRTDGSGAFTEGCGLTDVQAEILLYGICDTRGATNEETLAKLRRFFIVTAMDTEQLAELVAALRPLPTPTEEPKE